jgi:xanthine/CO dehydrogenase XdhC/CoxF family maturation factor/CTP:molybdopterin cytidylyltransferase MocA
LPGRRRELEQTPEEQGARAMPELRRIAEAVAKLVADGNRCALATIVDAEGSAYRREGARLLVAEDGSTVGAVSGGCLDADLLERARRVMGAGCAEIVAYDSNDQFDLVFGTGLGCGGRLTVLVEPMTPTLAAELGAARPARRGDLVAAVLWQGEPKGTRIMTPAAAEAEGLPVPDRGAVAKQAGLLVQRIEPPLRVVVYGAGPAAATLCNVAKDLDWIVEVADHREAARASGAFPRADAIVVAPVEELVAKTEPDENTAVVVMTHNVLRDQALVRHLVERRPFYVGILGPKKRSSKLLDDLRAEGVAPDETFAARLYGPTGLSLGAESPAEIALSIVAEIQAVRSGATPGHLRERGGPIHRRAGRGPVLGALLAAGGSSRLGRAKQLVEVGNETLLSRAAAALVESGAEESIAILGAGFQKVAGGIGPLPVEIVVNDEWPEGLSSSIRVAVREAVARGAEGLLLMLCDQPAVDGALSGRLVDHFRTSSAAVVACSYPEGGGVPAVFAASVFDRLASLHGDAGARDLIRSGALSVDLLPLDPGPDVDTPGDVERASAACGLDGARGDA